MECIRHVGISTGAVFIMPKQTAFANFTKYVSELQ